MPKSINSNPVACCIKLVNHQATEWINDPPLAVKPFWISAIRKGKKIPVSEVDFSGRWSVLLFYPRFFSESHWQELVLLSKYQDFFQERHIDLYPVIEEYWRMFRYRARPKASHGESTEGEATLHRSSIPFSVLCSLQFANVLRFGASV